MGWRRVLAAVLMLLAAGLCGAGVWLLLPDRPRFSYELDIGGRRVVQVWSERQHLPIDSDPNPQTVYYRVARGREELTATWSLEGDDGGDYRFAAATADGGQLACVYDADGRREWVTILYDAVSGESWPRDNANVWTNPAIKRKWRERFERLRRECPDCPMPGGLAE